MVFPVVMYGCESWTIKKAECWRIDAFFFFFWIDAFELWYWKRLLRVPWTETTVGHPHLLSSKSRNILFHISMYLNGCSMDHSLRSSCQTLLLTSAERTNLPQSVFSSGFFCCCCLSVFFFFKMFFDVGHFLSLYWICYNINSVLIFLWGGPRSTWELSSPTRDRTHYPHKGRQSLNHWTTREVRLSIFFSHKMHTFPPLVSHFLFFILK